MKFLRNYLYIKFFLIQIEDYDITVQIIVKTVSNCKLKQTKICPTQNITKECRYVHWFKVLTKSGTTRPSPISDMVIPSQTETRSGIDYTQLNRSSYRDKSFFPFQITAKVQQTVSKPENFKNQDRNS